MNNESPNRPEPREIPLLQRWVKGSPGLLEALQQWMVVVATTVAGERPALEVDVDDTQVKVRAMYGTPGTARVLSYVVLFRGNVSSEALAPRVGAIRDTARVGWRALNPDKQDDDPNAAGYEVLEEEHGRQKPITLPGEPFVRTPYLWRITAR